MKIRPPIIDGINQIRFLLINSEVLTTATVIIGNSCAPTPLYSFMKFGMTYVERTITSRIDAPTNTAGYASDFFILRRASVMVF